MKNVLFALLALILAYGAAFAVDGAVINIKAGLDVAGHAHESKGAKKADEDVKTGISLAGEYLFKMNDIIKLGGGIEYVIPRDIGVGYSFTTDPSISFLPIYLSAEITPIAPLRQLYFKGNLGYNVLFDVSGENVIADTKGGLYFAFGAGYVFDFGLFFEVLYGIYNGEIDYGWLIGDFRYTKLGLNAGYRFNI